MKKETAYYYFKLILGYIFLGLGILTLLFSRHFETKKLSTLLFTILAGWILFIIGIVILKRRKFHIFRRIKKELKENISYLRINGQLIQILHDNLTIGAASEIVEEYTSYPSKIVILDGMYGIDRRKRKVRKDYSIIVYEEISNGKKKQYCSPEIDKDYMTLSFLLEKQNFIDLYIDKNNADNYYFDLGFLKKQTGYNIGS